MEIKLNTNLKRKRWWYWLTISSANYGWTATSFLGANLSGSCTSGTHTYRVYARGQMRDDAGGANSSVSQTTLNLSC